MKVFGLTGGIGMGKSTVAQWLDRCGKPVVDTDILARQIVAPGQTALGEIQNAFGPEIVSEDGRLFRDKLAQIVFSSDANREKLEQILHPRIRELWKNQVALWRSESRSFAVVVIPLLFETGAESEFDVTVCVACSAATQRERLLARGWSQDQLEQRIAAQWPIQKKMERSDHVVWSEGGLDVLTDQVDRIFEACLPVSSFL
jgi:dephospho-CoA kinase